MTCCHKIRIAFCAFAIQFIAGEQPYFFEDIAEFGNTSSKRKNVLYYDFIFGKLRIYVEEEW